MVCHFGLSFPKWGEPSMLVPFRLHSNCSVVLIPVTVSHKFIGILLPVSGSTSVRTEAAITSPKYISFSFILPLNLIITKTVILASNRLQ